MFASTPGPYTGPVPMVTHVHGAVGIGDESDGYAEAWYLPDATNIPAATPPSAGGTTSSPQGLPPLRRDVDTRLGTFQYRTPNGPSTIWYHDQHARHDRG